MVNEKKNVIYIYEYGPAGPSEIILMCLKYLQKLIITIENSLCTIEVGQGLLLDL